MSIHIKIFVEGSSDKSFLLHYFDYLHIEKGSVQIFILGGKDDTNFRAGDFRSEDPSSAKNLVIIDADNDDLIIRRKHINNLLSSFDQPATAELFFLPNNTDCGNLEKLQKSIIPPIYAPFFECYDKLNDCIPTPYKLNLKDAIYAYQSTFLDANESEQRSHYIGTSPKYPIGERFWDYKSFNLDALKAFLLKHIPA
jgi:hypothetical protein